MILEPAKLNPLRWINTSNLNAGLDGNFARNQVANWQTYRPYCQKWQFSDRLKLQVIADSVPTDLQIVDGNTNAVVDNVSWTEIALNILNPDYLLFKVYEIDYPFNTLDAGCHYCSQDEYTSETFDLAETHLNTILLKYKSSQNNENVIFDTGIEFQFRVESYVSFEKPENERSVYPDQKHNLTQLSSQAIDSLKYYIGYGYGVPQWVLRKINTISTCDQVKFEDIPYQFKQDADFEVEKNTDNNYFGGSIDIEPTFNNFTRYKTSPVNGDTTFTPVVYVKQFNNVGADFNVPNTFKNFSQLEGITVYKRSVDDFILNIGTTIGGDDIGSFRIDQTRTYKQVQYPFDSTTTIFLSGLTDADVDIVLHWRQMDEAAIDFNNFIPQDTLKAGACMEWITPTGVDINDIWDFGTGLGKFNSGWEKWTINGYNGVQARDGKYAVGADVTSPGFDATVDLYVETGANEKTIAKVNLPAEPLYIGLKGSLYSSWNRSSGSARPIVGVGGTDINPGQTVPDGLTSNMGSGTPINIQPASIKSLFITKLQD